MYFVSTLFYTFFASIRKKYFFPGLFVILFSAIGVTNVLFSAELVPKQIIDFVSTGDWIKIIEYSQKLRDDEKTNPVVSFLISHAYAENYDEITQKRQYQIGRQYFRESLRSGQEFSVIINTFKTLTEQKPENSFFWYILSEAYFYKYYFFKTARDSQKALDEAIRCIEKAIRINPDMPSFRLLNSIIYLEKENFQQAFINFKKIRSPTARQLAIFGAMCFDKNLYDEAISYLNKVLTDFPEYEEKYHIYSLLAKCYGKKGEYDKVIDYSQKALEVPNPQKYVSYYLLGSAYLDKGEYEKAVTYYEKVISEFPRRKNLSPEDKMILLDTHGKISDIYFHHLKNYRKARYWYKKLVDIIYADPEKKQ